MLLRSAFKLVLATFYCLLLASFVNAKENTSDTSKAALKLAEPANDIVLEINGSINKTNHENSALFDMVMLQSLPVHTLNTTTIVTDGTHEFKGFLMRDLLEHIQTFGNTVTAIALNDYSVQIDIKDFYDFDVLIAYEMDGKQLQPSDKGPLWIVYPRDDHQKLQDIRYDYRWVWQLYKLQID